MCTNATIMELVCLSSKWNILKAFTAPGMRGGWHKWMRGEKWFNYGSTVPLEDSSGQMAGSGGTLLLIM